MSDNNIIKFKITNESSKIRLDIIIAKLIPHLTRSNLKKIIELKQVKINNSVEESPSTKLKTGDRIEINLTSTKEVKILPTKIRQQG